ncbi:hypothetical protein HK099_006700 [Clydaea vesicula]|uniref:PHD-type domain-containing protein n=1 Tax=Clydaea vesicula TaxID=447962 RepID=A0AAD5XYX3_9FUNG|nr:hypothetical protein HK099_006700 [Clydaea vesicula]
MINSLSDSSSSEEDDNSSDSSKDLSNSDDEIANKKQNSKRQKRIHISESKSNSKTVSGKGKSYLNHLAGKSVMKGKSTFSKKIQQPPLKCVKCFKSNPDISCKQCLNRYHSSCLNVPTDSLNYYCEKCFFKKNSSRGSEDDASSLTTLENFSSSFEEEEEEMGAYSKPLLDADNPSKTLPLNTSHFQNANQKKSVSIPIAASKPLSQNNNISKSKKSLHKVNKSIPVTKISVTMEDDDDEICPVCDGDCTCNESGSKMKSPSVIIPSLKPPFPVYLETTAKSKVKTNNVKKKTKGKSSAQRRRGRSKKLDAVEEGDDFMEVDFEGNKTSASKLLPQARIAEPEKEDTLVIVEDEDDDDIFALELNEALALDDDAGVKEIMDDPSGSDQDDNEAEIEELFSSDDELLLRTVFDEEDYESSIEMESMDEDEIVDQIVYTGWSTDEEEVDDAHFLFNGFSDSFSEDEVDVDPTLIHKSYNADPSNDSVASPASTDPLVDDEFANAVETSDADTIDNEDLMEDEEQAESLIDSSILPDKKNMMESLTLTTASLPQLPNDTELVHPDFVLTNPVSQSEPAIPLPLVSYDVKKSHVNSNGEIITTTKTMKFKMTAKRQAALNAKSNVVNGDSNQKKGKGKGKLKVKKESGVTPTLNPLAPSSVTLPLVPNSKTAAGKPPPISTVQNLPFHVAPSIANIPPNSSTALAIQAAAASILKSCGLPVNTTNGSNSTQLSPYATLALYNPFAATMAMMAATNPHMFLALSEMKNKENGPKSVGTGKNPSNTASGTSVSPTSTTNSPNSKIPKVTADGKVNNALTAFPFLFGQDGKGKLSTVANDKIAPEDQKNIAEKTEAALYDLIVTEEMEVEKDPSKNPFSVLNKTDGSKWEKVPIGVFRRSRKLTKNQHLTLKDISGAVRMGSTGEETLSKGIGKRNKPKQMKESEQILSPLFPPSIEGQFSPLFNLKGFSSPLFQVQSPLSENFAGIGFDAAEEYREKADNIDGIPELRLPESSVEVKKMENIKREGYLNGKISKKFEERGILVEDMMGKTRSASLLMNKMNGRSLLASEQKRRVNSSINKKRKRK